MDNLVPVTEGGDASVLTHRHLQLIQSLGNFSASDMDEIISNRAVDHAQERALCTAFVREWIANEGPIDFVFNNGFTPLGIAVSHQLYDIVVLLVAHGADIENGSSVNDPSTGEIVQEHSPLDLAVAHNDLQIFNASRCYFKAKDQIKIFKRAHG